MLGGPPEPVWMWLQREKFPTPPRNQTHCPVYNLVTVLTELSGLLKQTVRTKISCLHRGIDEFKKVYECKTDMIKDENDVMLVDSHSILNRLKNYFSQLLNVLHGVNNVMQVKIHAVEPLVPESSYFKVEIAIEKLARYKFPGIGQILVVLIQTGGRTLHLGIRKNFCSSGSNCR
jgi:hypothetical protein